MSSSLPGVAGVFERAADTYDSVGVAFFRPIAERLVAELDVRPGERVIDIGCGRGAALLPLAAAAGASGALLGVDVSPRMIALTAADVAGLPQVRLLVADATDLTLAEEFDVAASSLVLFFLADPAAVLGRWVRLLLPGGRLGISTFGPQDERWRSIDSVFDPYLPKAMLDARTSGGRGPFATDDGVAGLFSAAGLIDVRTVHQTVELRLSGAEHLMQFSLSHGQRAMWEIGTV